MMYSALHEPIPNLDFYFDRIGLRRFSVCDLANLDAMISAHQYHVPFENLDIYDYHLTISTAIKNLFDKIVTRKRGGYCFELNALFCSALRACGYEVTPCLARVIVGGSTSVPALHRQTIATLGGEKYICDVGFGGAQPGFALKIEDGNTQTGLGQTFRIDNTDTVEGNWKISYLSNDKWIPTIAFSTHKTVEEDFIAPNFYSYTHEDTKFVNSRVVNIRIPGGNKSILDDLFIINEDGRRTETAIESPKQLSEILETHFGIIYMI